VAVTEIHVGQTISHPSHGDGVITSVNGEVCFARFPSVGMKRFIKDFATGAWGSKRARPERPRYTESVRETEVSAADFVFDDDDEIIPPTALIDRTLEPEGILFVGGQSGAGKTFLEIYLSICLSSGEPFFGRCVNEIVGVLIIAAEGAGTIRARIRAARIARSLPSLPIASLAFSGNLSMDREVDDLIKRIQALSVAMRDRYGVRLGVVFIDTVAAAFALSGKGDPNAEAAATIKRLKRMGSATGALIAPIHHYGKDATTGLTGAHQWRAGADVVLSVLADRNEITGEVSNRSLSLAKHRSEAEGPIAPFDLTFVPIAVNDDGEVYGAPHVVPRLGEPISSKAARTKKEPRPLTAMREAFREACAEEGVTQAIMGDGPRLRVVELEAVKRRFRKRYVTGESDEKKANSTVRSGFSRAISDLSHLGLATGHWSDKEWIWDTKQGPVAGVAGVAE